MDASSLCNSISSTPYGFLTPSHELHLASRVATKNFLDPLASSLTSIQERRHRAQKNGGRDKKSTAYATKSRFRVQKLYTDGFSVGQVWEQVVRIIDESNDQLGNDIQAAAKSRQKDNVNEERLYSASSAASDGVLEDEEASQSGLESTSDIDSDQVSEDMEHMEDDGSLEEESGEEDESDSDIEDKSSTSDEDTPSETYVEDRFGLNDGFFSIDDFNKQSEYFENLDEKGAQEDLSDDEDIDWHADPEAAREHQSKPSKSDKQKFGDDENDDSMDSDAVDVFNDAELGEDESEEDLEDSEDWIDTNDIKYDDFFAPPPRKVSKKKSRPLPKTQPSQLPTEDDVERAISDVRRDLFEDFSDEADSDLDMKNAEETAGGRSTHEKQRAKIADEIRRLELANVTKKEWMLAGEAKATQRPLNSLIENDLEFERVGKPVPVVTNETSEEIEQLIKRRIVAREFDEVIRRLPDSVRQYENRGRVEIDQGKSQQSLAELYEKDHLKSNDPSYLDQKDEKLKREHAEIAQLWKDTSSQLDLLSNWHYKPSIPQPNINVIADVATVMMEDARPSGSGMVGEQGTLAPQEVYHPKDAKGFSGEVVLKNGVSVAKDEMSREEKFKRRRNEKKKSKSASQQPGKKAQTDEGQQILSDLKKGGVKMVGQAGELKALNERHKSGNAGASQSDSLKL